MNLSLTRALRVSFQAHAVVCVPLRHVRQDNLVTDLQTIHDFNGAHRTASQADRHTHGRLAAADQFEKSNFAVPVRLARAAPNKARSPVAPVESFRQRLSQVGPLRQCCVQCNIHGDGTILNCRVNADDMAWNQTVPRVNLCRLFQLYVLGLAFSDFDCGL